MTWPVTNEAEVEERSGIPGGEPEPLVVLMPSDQRLRPRKSIRPQEIAGEVFVGASNKATVLRAVIEDYLKRSGVDIKPDHGVDNIAMAMSLVASKRGLALMPAYAKDLLPGPSSERGLPERLLMVAPLA
jgi:LysR family hca operon transcriptional activator